MSELYLVRHGQASFGEKNYDRLSPVGNLQAEIAAGRIASVHRRFHAIYHGTMERQRETARALIRRYEDQGIPIPDLIEMEAFNEYDSFSVWEALIPGMLSETPSLADDLARVKSDRKAFQRLFEQVMHRWISGMYDTPGTLRWRDFQERVRKGIRDLMDRHGSGKRVVVFTSGGPISVAIQSALDLTDDKTMEISWQVMNASISRFKYAGGRMALAGFNDISHLETKGDPSLLTYR